MCITYVPRLPHRFFGMSYLHYYKCVYYVLFSSDEFYFSDGLTTYIYKIVFERDSGRETEIVWFMEEL